MARPTYEIPKGTMFDIQSGRWLAPRPALAFNGLDGIGPRLPTDERGLIICPPTEFVCDSISMEPRFDAQELRFALLFWDLLVYPRTAADPLMQSDPEIDLLLSEGLLRRPLVKVIVADSFTAPELIKFAFVETLRELGKRDQNRWSLARGERTLAMIDDSNEPIPSASFELHKAIPVPNRDVPLHEVLEFKRRRAAELSSLRARLDEVYARIVAAPDRPLAELTEMEALSSAIADHLKVAREWKFPLRLTGFKAKLDIKSWGGAAGGYQFAASALGLSPMLAAVGGVAGGILASLSADVGWRQRRHGSNPYEYVSRYHSEVF